MQSHKPDKIYLSPPHLGENESKYIQAAIASNWIAPIGEYLDRFEQAICDFTAAKYALALNSGTSAIHLALMLLGVGRGDEVLCSSFTFAATANPIIYLGAKPIFIDSEALTWNISPEFVEIAIKDRLRQGKKPKAMIVVHLYGNPAQMEDLMYLSNRYEIPIIEDAAEALGATYQGKSLGSFGSLGIFSFNGNKIITTSAGGALISNDKDLIAKGLFWATQAKDKAPHYQHSEIGYNYRLSNILAGIGLGQMEVLHERIQKRRANFEFYQKKLPQFAFQKETTDAFSNRWLSCLLLQNAKYADFHHRFELENIEVRPLWKPLHLQPIFKDYSFYGETIAEDLFNSGLCLPSGSALQEEDLERVVSVLNLGLQ